MDWYNLFIVILMFVVCLVIPYFTIKSLMKKDWCLSKILSLITSVFIGIAWLVGFYGFGNLKERNLSELVHVSGNGKIIDNNFVLYCNDELYISRFTLELLDSDMGKNYNIITKLRDIPLDNIELWYYDDGFLGFHYRYVYQISVDGEIIYPVSIANNNLVKDSSYLEARIVLYISCILRMMLAYLFLWNILINYFIERKK